MSTVIFTKFMNFKKNIEYLLKKHNMSKSELARKLNFSRQRIGQLLNQEDQYISTCVKICSIFKVTLDDLIIKDLTI